MNAPTYQARLTSTPPLTVEGVTGGQSTPGNVGVCLSGGGTRALTAGMGQLRALKYLQANGKSLLSQVKALSTVSGGSWLGVTYAYLKGDTTDDQFLNKYVADPGGLVPNNGSSTAVTLDELPPGNIGAPSTGNFSLPALALEAVGLIIGQTPPDMVWQVLIGRHILNPYGLYLPRALPSLPKSMFSWSEATRQSDIVGPNPSLENEACFLVASQADSNRTPRPYLICNMSMFVTDSDGNSAIAPVQTTPFFSGIVGQPPATDANGKTIGGGGVTSFAFNSALSSVSSPNVTVEQSRQWSLTDSAGTSSAAFAGVLHELFSGSARDLSDFMPPAQVKELEDSEVVETIRDSIQDSMTEAGGIESFIPSYNYWPVLNAVADPNAKNTEFGDGGLFENTGIGSMLSYTDIDSIIAFVNASSGIAAGDKGVIASSGNEIPGTAIVVDEQVPVLFGYQPYDDSKGYVLFSAGGGEDNPMRNAQIFPSESFADLLKLWWKNSGNEASPGSNTSPAIATQTLQTVQNDWFGIAPGRTVTVVWYYLNEIKSWENLLQSDVQEIVRSTANFPNYSTFTQLSINSTEVNLLSSLTAWSVGNDANASAFTDLFRTSSGPLPSAAAGSGGPPLVEIGKLGRNWIFFREFLRQASVTGAVAPSSRGLAREIVSGINVDTAEVVVEYGPGTGSFTAELLQRVTPGAVYFAIEKSPVFVESLRTRFPELDLVEDSVTNLGELLAARSLSSVDCIVSGLPFASFEESLQNSILDVTLDALGDGGCFVTFAYLQGLLVPAGRRFRRLINERFRRVEQSRVVWFNLPPAFVYRCFV